MSLISQSIPNLFGGVSQQPAQVRFPNQLEEVVNCTSDPVEGLSKRPPTEHVAKLLATAAPVRPAVFPIDRDPNTRFIGMVSEGRVRVFDITDGTEKTVTGGVNAYLNSAAPATDIKVSTVADYTFIANRSISTAKTADKAPSRPFEALLFVRAGNFARTYEVWIDDTLVASVKTPNGDFPEQSGSADTSAIAEALFDGTKAHPDMEVNGTLSGAAGITATREGSVIYLTSGSDFEIRTEDGQGGEAMRALKDSVQRLSDLPKEGIDGFVIEVAGDPTSDLDSYWVQYTEGVWKETVKPGADIRLDAATMPHALIRNPDDTFELQTLPWVDREAGDDARAPFPSFVGRPINGVFYFRNRVGFLSDENMILSKAGDYFNFFRTTATQLLDDDRIDTPAGDYSGESSPVSILEHAVAFDRKLVLFAANAQFILDSDGALTPRTARLDPVTTFQNSPDCRPHGAGRFVYFVFDRNGASGVREFYLDGAAQTEDAPEVTAHCPTYLPANIVKLSGSTLENVMLAFSTDRPNEVFSYEYFWDGTEKLQSAWTSWEFDPGDTILSCDFFDNTAYLVVERADGVFLERMRFRPDLKDTDLDYFTLIDRRVENPTVSYDAFGDETVITLPYEPPASVEVVTLKSPGDLHAPGDKLTVNSVSGSTVRVAGDRTAYTLLAGVPYTARFTLTQPFFMRPSTGGGLVADTEAILKLRDYSLDFTGTGYFRAVFTPKGRSAVTKVFSGNITGATALSIPDLDEGTFRIKTPTRNRNWSLQIINDSPFPSSFLAASWRGLIESKSRRV